MAKMEMELQRPSDTVFVTYEQDIKRLFKPDEQERVRELLREAERQSNERKVIRVREPMSKWKKGIKNFQWKWKYGVHWKGTLGIGYPLRLARNFLLAKYYDTFKIDKYVFRGMEIALHWDCVFQCTHCLCSRLAEENRGKKVLSPDEWRRVVNEAMKLGATTFGLEGGEPLLIKDWEEYAKAFRGDKNHLIISTNGYLFTEEVAKKCKELGIDTINISCDSGIPELHDLFRRKRGAFEGVMKTVGLCKKYGLKPLLNNCCHKGNLYTRGFIELMEYCENNDVFLNILFAKGVGAFKDKNCMLEPEDFISFHKIVEPYSCVFVHHMGLIKYNYGNIGCPGVKEMLNMTPYGDALNCANMHIIFGNVRDEPISLIRDRALKDTPFGGKYMPCYLTMNPDFMNIYYPLFEGNRHISIDQFRDALEEYERKHNKVLFPQMKKSYKPYTKQ